MKESIISTWYRVDWGEGWFMTLSVTYLKEAMEGAERGMVYSGLPVYIEDMNGRRIMVSEFVEGDPKENGHKYLKIVEKDGKKAYYKEWQSYVELELD